MACFLPRELTDFTFLDFLSIWQILFSHAFSCDQVIKYYSLVKEYCKAEPQTNIIPSVGHTVISVFSFHCHVNQYSTILFYLL